MHGSQEGVTKKDILEFVKKVGILFIIEAHESLVCVFFAL